MNLVEQHKPDVGIMKTAPRREEVAMNIAPPPTPSSGRARSVLAAIIGNALEWFDLVVYGFFAAVIARLFFPAHDPSVSVILAFGTFGASFLIRPLGAVVIGRYADRAGRKAALVLVSGLMLLGTLMIAVLPTYAQIGAAAPVLLLAARLVQGFSAGGEFGSATAFLAEQEPSRRGYYSSWQFASQGIATLLASGFGLALTTGLSDTQLDSWGWRLPFLFGLLIGPAAYFIRIHTHETDEFLASGASATVADPMDMHFIARVAVGCGAMLVATVSMYLMLYMPTFAQTSLGLPSSAGFVATLVTGVTLLVLPPFAGILSDRKGRLFVALPAVLVLVAAPIPLFLWLIAAPSAERIMVVQGLLGIATALYFGALPAMLVELFPVSLRTTGLSLCYNLAVVIAGGFAPLLFAALIRLSGSAAAPSGYLALSAVLSLAALLVARKLKWAW